MRRAFWAIGISDAVREAVRSVRGQVNDPALRWTPPENLHVTLKYLGETELAVAALLEAARPSCEGIGALQLELGEIGSFGRPPRVIWLGLGGPGRSKLCLLAAGLDTACGELGFPRETRPFAPHLTLARVRRGKRTQRPSGVSVTSVSFAAEALLLLESRPGQPYAELARLEL